MGASESTGRSNSSRSEDEDRQPETGGGSAAAIAIAAAGAAAAAWGVSRMLSDNNTNTEQNNAHTMSVQASPANNRNYNNGAYSTPTVVFQSPRPIQRHFKMNTDGACRPTVNVPSENGNQQVLRGPSGYGGILRDPNGNWVRGFRGFIGVTDCLTAEFHGIRRGLQLMDELCVEDSVLESDSTAAVEWVNYDDIKLYPSKSQIINNCWGIIEECMRLKDKNRITVRCISRDANKCADKLANMGIDRRESYMEIVDVPVEIKEIVNRESSNLLIS